MRQWSLAAAVACCSLGGTGFAEIPVATSLTARDSLDATSDPLPDAQACLDRLTWMPQEFAVQIAPESDQDYDALVSFPSPAASGDAVNDRVTMEWYQPRPREGEVPGPRPAMVVVHESGSQMEAGRVFARSFRGRGLQAFLIHLPYYGERRKGGGRPENADFTMLVRQGIGDVRRARDAVAVLPGVDPAHVGLQGTSLGGFVTTLVGSLDRGYQDVFIMLAGADFYDILQTGQKDTAKLRDKFAQAGYEGERLRELLSPVESLRIAHRLDPAHTWMYSAQDDEVVPIKNARLLATTSRLERSHQLEFPGGHYSVALYFPFIVDHVAQQMLPREDAAP
ncbi:MAG: hypothetical protein JNG89_08570 [Planctomycetaceae bacterium]|nr:hypothetical protein [Planctomycetaceae bacterium]